MLLFATYCSANKDGASSPLAARDRYLSDRIAGVEANANAANTRFGILSGKFGLLSPDHPIPAYDHLLHRDEIDEMTTTVAETLKDWDITAVRWFSVAFEMDPNVRRYKNVMENAAKQHGIDFEILLWEPTGLLGLI
jgi:hypothetical protein